jgi:hypothetical protein
VAGRRSLHVREKIKYFYERGEFIRFVPTLKQKNNERVGLTNDLHGLAEELIRRSVDELQQ